MVQNLSRTCDFQILKKLEGKVIALDMDIIYNIYYRLPGPVVDEKNGILIIKHDFIVEDGCGARHRVCLKLPLSIELGLRLSPIPIDEARNVFPIVLDHYKCFKRQIFNTVIYTCGQNIKYYSLNSSSLKAFIPVTLRGNKLVPVNASEADYAMLLLTNRVSSKSFSAKLDIDGEVEVCKGTTSCARESISMALVIVRKGAKFSVTLNNPPFRGSEDNIYTRHLNFDGVNLIETFDYSVPII